ncbi:bifunctional nuclease family protein [Paludibacter sp. 221]|uniref:bifunctional nuclease family protein n=1 Tax=Paludibacter sp. 221 TaxID=2302939 RepID=UPI0013D7F509|nr:bifunctional nuclease family protein [Paludibacter sp. 221]
MEQEVKLEIVGLVYNQSVVNTYGLVMREADGIRRFSVMIGEPEAQSIALKMNNKVLARPLTHDLIKNVLLTLHAELKKVLIYDLVNEIFYSELYLETAEGKKFVIDARTSDAVALAVRIECPIYIKREILDIVGAEVESEEFERKTSYTLAELEKASAEEMRLLSAEELDEFLTQAVNEEKYELAVTLRNVLEQKKSKDQ